MNNKELFLDFINRYHLQGKIDRALIEFHDDHIFTSAYNTSEHVYSEIKIKKNPLNFNNYKIGIADTNSLIRLLKAFDDPSIELYFNEYNQNDNDPHSLVIEEGNVRSNFLLTERGVVKPFNQELPREIECIYEIKIDEELIEKFNKYKLLLKDETRDFSFFQRENRVHILFGKKRFAGSNNISIKLNIEPLENYTKEIIFPIDTFYSVIDTNKDTNINLQIKDAGMIVQCTSELYDNCYLISASKHKE